MPWSYPFNNDEGWDAEGYPDRANLGKETCLLRHCILK